MHYKAFGDYKNISKKRIFDLLCGNASRILNIPVSHELIEYRLEEKIDDLQYNYGKVLNPWNGSKLLFPVKI